MYTKSSRDKISSAGRDSAGDVLLPLSILSSYFILKPFYLFPVGNPQIADFLIVILFVVTILKFGPYISNYSYISKSIWLFIFYTFIINLAWAAILQDIDMLKVPLFYAFNGVLTYVLFVCYQQDRQRVFKFM